MVLAHGFGCDQHMWRFVAPTFKPDFRTVVFDNVGAGGSDLSAYDAGKYATLGGYADDLIDITGELACWGPFSSATRSAPSAGGNSLLDASARAMMRARGVWRVRLRRRRSELCGRQSTWLRP